MLKKIIPAFDWLKNYKKTDFRGDLSAGIIVAIMLVPQGMAYAMLAGLPAVVGLYAATIPLIVYALFGTSRHLAVGPVAIVSLFVFAGVSTIAEPGTDEYISYVLLLMLMVGLLQFLMGMFRLGFLVNFISHPVISGFTSAAAITIGISQLTHLLGVPVESNHPLFILWESVLNLPNINWVTFTIGASSIAVILVLKKYFRKVPGPLIVVIVSIAFVQLLQLQTYDLSIVGEVPKGLPTFSVPIFTIDALVSLFPIAVTIAFIGFMESIAMAKALAAKEKYNIEPNKELIGLGLANVAGSFFSAYPVTGGFSRSAVNYEAGARTPLASIMTAGIILFTLLFFTEFFYYLPQATLAAIIIVAVSSLIDVKEVKFLFSVRKADGWTWVITFASTLLFGIMQGILIGIAFSMLVLIGRSAYPQVAELGYLRETKAFRNVKRYSEAKVDPEVLIFRADTSLTFTNIAFIERKLREYADKKPQLKTIILDFSSVNTLDAVALMSLKNMLADYKQKKIQCVFAHVKAPVSEMLKKVGINEDVQYWSLEHALEAIGKSFK